MPRSKDKAQRKLRDPPTAATLAKRCANKDEKHAAFLVLLRMGFLALLGSSPRPRQPLVRHFDQDLSPQQKRYAAMDVIVPLRIHKYLSVMPDFTERLTPDAALAGCAVDIVPPHGSLVTMATRVR